MVGAAAVHSKGPFLGSFQPYFSSDGVVLLFVMASKSIGCGGILMIFIFAGMEIYPLINRTGWIWHKRTVDMYADSGWSQGQTRKCMGVQRNSEDGLFALFCPEDYFGKSDEVAQVKFWGRVSRPDTFTGPLSAAYRWNCTKNAKGYVCRALD